MFCSTLGVLTSASCQHHDNKEHACNVLVRYRMFSIIHQLLAVLIVILTKNQDDHAIVATNLIHHHSSSFVQTAAASVKEKIVFVQHVNPSISENDVYDKFDRFGKLTKCERLHPAKDVWMLQYSKAEVCSYTDTLIPLLSTALSLQFNC